MEAIAQAEKLPTTEELIKLLGKEILAVMQTECADENDSDRVWLLRIIHRNYTYYRDLMNFVASSLSGIINVTGISGPINPATDEYQQGDYSQNIFRGYCRKLEGVLGNRMPGCVAVPNDPDNEEAIRASKSGNAAALYFIHKCELKLLTLELIFGIFNFGTNFGRVDYEVDGDKYGYDLVPDPNAPQTVQSAMGNSEFVCPACTAAIPADPNNPVPPPMCPQCGGPIGMQDYHPPTQVTVPNPNIPKIQKAKGAIRITLHNASEVSVPLDSNGVDDDNCGWLRYARDKHKSKLLQKFGDALRNKKSESSPEESVSDQYAKQVRSAMASPIGIVRPARTNYWTESDTWWKPSMYEMIDDKSKRELLKKMFPKGLIYTTVKGEIMDIRNGVLNKDWRECKPEPSTRVMADPLGNDWTQPQELLNNGLNQGNETLERANEPGFGDPTKIDFDAYQDRRSQPGDLFPAIRPAGGRLADIIHRPEPLRFSDQLVPFGASIEERAKNISGLTDAVWGGGDNEEPTARQAELKKNAAIQQLSVQWMMIGRFMEKLNKQACEKLAEYEEGVIEFSKKNQFGKYDKQTVVAKDLKSDLFHFEADEAIPMTWGQQRDLLMWMLDKPAELYQKWGFDDPLNIFTFKQLLGMPGERTPQLDDRDKGMEVIAQLLEQQPIPGEVDPATGQPGPDKPSIEPDWEDDHAFMASLTKAYLIVNHSLKTDKPDGYKNVLAWGKAQDEMANAPAPAEPIKSNVSLSLKGQDLGDPAVTAALEKTGIIPPGTPVEAVIPPPSNGIMPPPGMGAPPTTGMTQ